jgi:hypothetical protein
MRNKVIQRVKDERLYPKLSEKNEVYLDWSHLACKLSSKHVIEIKMQGRIKVTERQGRRRKMLLDGLKERRGY